MSRRLAQWSLSHHFLSCCSSRPKGKLQAALQGWIVQALCCRHIAFSRTVTSQRLSAIGKLLPGVGGLSLASTVPPRWPNGSSPLTAAGHHSLGEVGVGGCLPAPWPPRLDPFPCLPSSAHDFSFRMTSRQPSTMTRPKQGLPKADLSSVGLGTAGLPGPVPSQPVVSFLWFCTLFTARHSPLSVTSSWTQASVSWQMGMKPNSFVISLIPGVL